MAARKVINSERAPLAVGPYNQAVVTDGWVFTAGQIGIDPKTNKLAEGGVAAQAEQAMKNLEHVLAAAGSSMAEVVKTTLYLTDMGDFIEVNGIYGQRWTVDPPARCTVAVAGLPLNASVEIEMIARTKSKK